MPQQLPADYIRAKPVSIDDIRTYQGVKYYRVHFEDNIVDPVYLHKDQGIQLSELIKEFNRQPRQKKSIDPMEWEVQSIQGSRIVDGQTEYLVKWKYWIGDTSWLKEEDCNCLNLIAAYENPKLDRMFSFSGNNKKLWIEHCRMDFFINRIVTTYPIKAHVLESKNEQDCIKWTDKIEDGLNVGCLLHENHWYVVFIFKNYISITSFILALDSLNTMIAPNLSHHPIILRLKKVFPRYPIRPAKMTPMDRSDMCAFYALAAIERGLFLFNPHANFICESILFHPVRAEYLRSVLAPQTNGQLSVALRTKEDSFCCPICEFCRQDYDDFKSLDEHIEKKHFRKFPLRDKQCAQRKTSLN